MLEILKTAVPIPSHLGVIPEHVHHKAAVIKEDAESSGSEKVCLRLRSQEAFDVWNFGAQHL